MSLTLRAAGVDDAPAFHELARETGETWDLRDPDDFRFLLTEAALGEGAGAVLAEADGETVAAAAGSMRSDVWRLGFLAARPDHPGALTRVLSAVLEHPRKRPGRVPLAACPSAGNARLVGQLTAEGILPHLPLLRVEGKPAPQTGGSAPLDVTPLEPGEETLHRLLFWDNAILAARPRDHAYLAQREDVAGFLYHKGARVVGYTYVHGNGHVGPAAAADVEFLPSLLSHACDLAADRSGGTVNAILPGVSRAGTHFLLKELRLPVVEVLTLCTLRFSGAWDVALPWNRAFL